jgi:hypothetical protein
MVEEDTRLDFPAFTYLQLNDIFLGLIVALRIPKGLKVLGVLFYVYACYRGVTYYTVHSPWYNYALGCALGTNIFSGIDFVVATDLWQLRWDPERTNVAFDSLSWWERVFWVLCFKGSCRGINYNLEVRPSKHRKSSFS